MQQWEEEEGRRGGKRVKNSHLFPPPPAKKRGRPWDPPMPPAKRRNMSELEELEHVANGGARRKKPLTEDEIDMIHAMEFFVKEGEEKEGRRRGKKREYDLDGEDEEEDTGIPYKSRPVSYY